MKIRAHYSIENAEETRSLPKLLNQSLSMIMLKVGLDSLLKKWDTAQMLLVN